MEIFKLLRNRGIVLEIRVKAEIMLLVVTILWAFSFPAMKISLYYISPYTFLCYRYALATLLLLLLCKNEIFNNRVAIKPGSLIGISLGIGQVLQTVGLVYTSSSHSAFITSLYIVFAPLIAYYLLREKIESINIISLLIALIGLYLLTGVRESILNMNFGDFLTILCAIAFAVQIVLVQKYTLEGIDYKALTFWQVLLSLLMYIPLANYSETININLIALIGIIYTAVGSTVLALIIMLKYQKYTSVQRASIIYVGEPVFACLASLALLHEILNFEGYIGSALIVFSLLLLHIKVKK